MTAVDRATEQEHLRKAEAGIAEANGRIDRQRALLARLESDGHDTGMAKDLLQTMCETLAAMEQHRQLILEELGR